METRSDVSLPASKLLEQVCVSPSTDQNDHLVSTDVTQLGCPHFAVQTPPSVGSVDAPVNRMRRSE